MVDFFQPVAVHVELVILFKLSVNPVLPLHKPPFRTKTVLDLLILNLPIYKNFFIICLFAQQFLVIVLKVLKFVNLVHLEILTNLGAQKPKIRL